LAAMNHPVTLIDRSPSIGGNMILLDKTFPTNDCSTCMISPRMVACARHPLIRILTLAELTDLGGEPGRFTARIVQHPRYVDEEACIACRACVDKCPRKVPNEFNFGLNDRKAIYFAHAQSIPMTPSIDAASCIFLQKGRCGACEKVCQAGAIRLDDREKHLEFAVGAVILSAGYELAVDPLAGEFGYKRYPNVVTNLEYERMLSAAGPFGGHPTRLSDGRTPRRTAWIQCVASRDSARKRNFCSSVCCMAAVKQAMITLEHDSDARATVFFMDMRAHGKDFDRYVQRAGDTYGVRFVRSMISKIVMIPSSQNLLIEYFDRETMERREEEYELVVLSAGMSPSPGFLPVLGRLGLERNSYGFVVSDMERPGHTSREGIFVCGTLDGPKDIPDSVSGAAAAASGAAAMLAEGRREEPADSTLPAQRDVAGEPPRIGVFVCHCGTNIAGVVNVEALTGFAAALPGVAVAEHFLFTCSTQSQERIREVIHEHRLNRVVVAACSPRTHEPLFRETLLQSGLNKYLFERANNRDQCSWVHGQEPVAATDKSRHLLRAAVARAALLEPIREVATRVVRRALVVGAGLAGMTAALTLADLGIEAVLVEKESSPGGSAAEVYATLEGRSPRRLAEELSDRVGSHRNVVLYTEATVKSVSGGPGRFTASIERNGTREETDFGAIIVATGGETYRPKEYCYGEHPAVLTQLELEKRLHSGGHPSPQSTVMIQCIGSRRDDFALCSRICCSAAVKNAISLMERNPRGTVTILYRDMRTFGFKEEYYKRARDLGVIFVRFDPESPPDVRIDGNGGLRVVCHDASSRRDLEIRPDLLVLSAGIRPRPGGAEIAKMLKLPLMQEGFFLEAHPKLNPLDCPGAGIFLCGLAHSPRFMEESLSQARGAACRAAGLLLRREITTSGTVAEVDRERCAACLLCVYSCPYKVPYIDGEGISVIDPRKCQGCGVCVSECPAKAITFHHYTDAQVVAQARGAAG
ncbi:MAG: FAD-dependent oxidoreductase, partial [Desulfobacteraceae bacterium]|nr:FAD-dependent oxidoreductase [Desulfobacteraceae bacterium]